MNVKATPAEISVRGHGRIRSLVHDLTVEADDLVFYILAGFWFDGASVPWFLWWWVSPWDAWVVLAACVHDWLYKTHACDRLTADRILRELLYQEASRTGWRWLRYKRLVKTRVIYHAVRTFGGDRW